MQGQILSVASTNSQGAIQGDDGVQYSFTPFGWRDSTVVAAPGMAVDFEVRGSHAVGIYPLPGSAPPVATTLSLQGSILREARSDSPGAIIGDNGIQYTFTLGGWGNPSARAVPGTRADFKAQGSLASDVYPIQGAAYTPPTTFASPPPQQPSTAPPVPAQSGGQRTAGHPQSAAPAAQPSRSGILIGALIAIVVLGVIGAGAYLFFQQARSDEEIALEVARDWSSSGIDDISELAMGLLVGNAPIVTQIGGGVLADKIRDKVAWSYSEARCPREGQCEVTATASAALDINIPFVFNDTVTIELPFDLDIDTGARRVNDWDADIGAASVQGIELGDMGEGIQQAMDSSSEDVRRAVRRLQEFAEDEDVQRAVSDAADTIRSFTEDEDVQRAVSDTTETIRSFAEDEDVERTIKDTSDAVQSGIKSFFGD